MKNKILNSVNLCSKNATFKPIIASSLVLMLGINVFATQPEIKYAIDSGVNKPINPSDQKLGWNGSSGGGESSFWTLKTDSGAAAPVEITFKFDQNGNGAGILKDATYTVSLSGKTTNSKTPMLIFQSIDRGIDMQGKALSFDFLAVDSDFVDWNGAFKRRMTLNLGGVSKEGQKNISFKGDITIKSGKGIDNENNFSNPRPNHQSVNNANEFVATFNGDMIGNITISPSDIKDPNILKPSGESYVDGAASGYRDIKSIFTFNKGASLQGDIRANAGQNTFVFNEGSVIGNITADNGYKQDNKNWNAGSENEYLGAINNITFLGETTGIVGNIKAANSGQNIIAFGENTIASFKGTILSGIESGILTSNVNHNNIVIFNGKSAMIGSSSDTVSAIKIDNRTGTGLGTGKFSHNTLIFNAKTSNNLYLTELSVFGDYGASAPENKTFNAISLNRDTTNTIEIKQISSRFGSNIIGKNIFTSITQDGKITERYNENLFKIQTVQAVVDYKVSGIAIKENFVSEFMKSSYQAKGTLKISGSGDVIITNGYGSNYLNVETLDIKNDSSAQSISATWGQNLIRANIINLGAEKINQINLKVDGDNATSQAKNSIISMGKMTAFFGTLSAQGSNSNGGKHINEVIGGIGSKIDINHLVAQNDVNNSNNISIESGDITLGRVRASGGGKNNIATRGDGKIMVTDNIIASENNAQNNFALLGDNSSLTLKGRVSGNTTHQISTLDASGENISLILDNSDLSISGVMSTSIFNTLDTPNLSVVMQGGANSSKSVNLALKGANNIIQTITLQNASTDVNSNKIILENGKTTIRQGVLIEQDKAIAFDVKNNAELLLSGDLTNNGKVKISTINGGIISGNITSKNEGQTLIESLDATGTTIINGTFQVIGDSKVKNATNTLVLNGNTQIRGSLIASVGTFASSGYKGGINNLTFRGKVNSITGNIQTKGNKAISGENNITLGGSDVTLNLQGSVNQITKLVLGEENTKNATLVISGNPSSSTTLINSLETRASGTNHISLSNTTTTIQSAINADGSKNVALTLNNNATLNLEGSANKISSLNATKGALINLAMTDSNGYLESERNAKVLEIGGTKGVPMGFKGEAVFEVYARKDRADVITFKSAQLQEKTSEKSVATITASGDIETILNGDGTLKVAVVERDAKNNIEVLGGERLVGGIVAKTVLVQKENNDTEYYLGKGVDKGAPIQYQEVASSALMVNYDLYLANFNSLNKRMGELRDNPYTQGVWARVFGGSTSNDFGSGSKTNYITTQAGYDYALTLGNAKNYIGIALAYGKSWAKGNALSMNGLVGASQSISLSSVDSNMVEVGIYNSYIADNGWYNDTILKFDYILSKFALSNKSELYTNTNNFAMILSNEFGYRYKFGRHKSWYIDPQLEMAFGYFNQSDFNRAMYDTSGVFQSMMQARQNMILTLRARTGVSLGKRFSTERGFADIYAGIFYEYDYIHGGHTSVLGRVGGTITSLEGIKSSGRAITNIGSNIALSQSVRFYIDVEKSFGNQQRTFMQFNVGARYSFGKQSLSAPTQERKVAPLKPEQLEE